MDAVLRQPGCEATVEIADAVRCRRVKRGDFDLERVEQRAVLVVEPLERVAGAAIS